MSVCICLGASYVAMLVAIWVCTYIATCVVFVV